MERLGGWTADGGRRVTGLVESTRIGHWTYFRRNDDRIAALPELLKGSL